MTEHVLSALIKRRAEVAGEAEATRTRLTQLTANLGHLDAVIRQFDPEYDVDSIRAKRVRPLDAAGPGERSRLVLNILRRAGEPIPASEITRCVMTETGLDAADRIKRLQTARRTDAVLSRQERRGVVRAVREPGKMVLWKVARG